ncbi:MAG: GGDEF domain-containing protein, partial [Lysobacteraceae bacterium]
ARALALADAVQERRDLLTKAVAARQIGNTMPSLPTTGAASARRIADAIITVEAQLLDQHRESLGATASITRTLTTAAIVLSIIFLVLAFWLIDRTHKRQLEQQRTLRDANMQLQDTLVESRRLSESMQRLARFGEMLQSCRDMDEIRHGVQEALAELLPGLGGRLALLNPSQNLLAIGAHWGTHGLIAESVFPPEDCWALRRGQAYPLSGTNSGFVCKHVHWPNPDFPESTYFCVPLTAQGEVIGVLTIDGLRAIDQLERRLGIAASEQLALSLANIRLQDTLRTQSIRDPLTGLFNRRYLEVSFERELLRATRRTLPLAVLMLDLDHFKRFNDSHGHEAGDAVLAQFAEVLKRATRSEDIACRYGGEEFTIVLQEADESIARERAELIRTMTSEMSVSHRQEQLEHVTVSIGYAVFPRDGTTADDLLRRADTALYAAKRSGRNRVASALGNPAKATV